MPKESPGHAKQKRKERETETRRPRGNARGCPRTRASTVVPSRGRLFLFLSTPVRLTPRTPTHERHFLCTQHGVGVHLSTPPPRPLPAALSLWGDLRLDACLKPCCALTPGPLKSPPIPYPGSPGALTRLAEVTSHSGQANRVSHATTDFATSDPATRGCRNGGNCPDPPGPTQAPAALKTREVCAHSLLLPSDSPKPPSSLLPNARFEAALRHPDSRADMISPPPPPCSKLWDNFSTLTFS